MTDSRANDIFCLLLFWAGPVHGLVRSNLTTGTASNAPFGKEMMYTQNSLCRKNYCTNPIFPGLNDLPRLEALQWQCSTTSVTHQYMDFCKDAVVYDPALPSPVSKATAVTELVKAQEDAAMTMFVYHLNGMGYEAWDYRKPSETDNDCVRSVWKMVCFTYFPRAEAGCKAGEQSSYKRPCKSCCHNYIRQCGVECCDESVQCSFAHTSTSANGSVQLLQTGYVDKNGPSAACTGGARRSMTSPIILLLGIFSLHCIAASSHTEAQHEDVHQRRKYSRGFGNYFLFCLIALLALSLQGCGMNIPHHSVGNWRTKQNYLTEFQYTAPGKAPVLNSCLQPNVTKSLQCSGRGYCRSFSMNSIASQQSASPPMAFCHCERDWADPECGTKRKSQAKAFFWSLFLGFTGADYFYLGFPLWGLGKLCTLGGLGFWWLIDVVRTGAGPVYAHNFRTSHDLPHWVAVLIMVFLCMFTGFAVAIRNYLVYRKHIRQELAEFMSKEEARKWHKTEEELEGFGGPRFRTRGFPSFEKRPEFCGYGATLPLPHPNANTPFATTGLNAGPFGPAGMPGQGSPTPPGQGIAPTHMGLSREGLMPHMDDNEIF